MLAVARTFALLGVEAREVAVEVDVNRGLPTFSVVGLPDAAVREARERVRGALANSGFEFPLRRITANLAPADLRKVGPGFDLAIAAALLAASGQLPAELLTRYALAGELALDGSIRPTRGVLAMAEATMRTLPGIAVAAQSGPEAALVSGLEVLPLERLDQLGALARGEWAPQPPKPPAIAAANDSLPDLADLRGQPLVRAALEVVAAGGHSLLMIGPPGSGKSLAARRLASIMPPLAHEEALDVMRIAGACGTGPPGEVAARRPYRAPHHTISAAGLVGGGPTPRAGEVTLAHRGVLFLDELGEFSRSALEALRQPLEDGSVSVSRAGGTITLPCRFTFIAAANPCPCGRGADSQECRCGPVQIGRYDAKLSGPLADRIDICLAVDQPSAEAMAGDAGERSMSVRARVVEARERQQHRLEGRCNAEMTAADTRAHCILDSAGRRILADSHARQSLSGRGHERVLRLARTIADLAGRERIEPADVHEALALRRRDKSETSVPGDPGDEP